MSSGKLNDMLFVADRSTRGQSLRPQIPDALESATNGAHNPIVLLALYNYFELLLNFMMVSIKFQKHGV